MLYLAYTANCRQKQVNGQIIPLFSIGSLVFKKLLSKEKKISLKLQVYLYLLEYFIRKQF